MLGCCNKLRGAFNSDGRQEGKEKEEEEKGGEGSKKCGSGVENKRHYFDSSSLKGPSSPFTVAQ